MAGVCGTIYSTRYQWRLQLIMGCLSCESAVRWSANLHTCHHIAAASIPGRLQVCGDDTSFNGRDPSVHELNQGEMPTITLDQPLYAITKRIQWTWPEQYGEDQFIVILGGLHIEMAAIKVLGDWLDDSGWVEALVQAGVASAATADSFIKAARVTRTRHAHQVTASSLYTLLKKAYAKEKTVEMENELLKFVRWCNERCSERWWRSCRSNTKLWSFATVGSCWSWAGKTNCKVW